MELPADFLSLGRGYFTITVRDSDLYLYIPEGIITVRDRDHYRYDPNGAAIMI